MRPDRIDGVEGAENISYVWARKFGGVLNCLEDEKFKQDFYTLLNRCEESDIESVTVQEIKKHNPQIKVS